MGFKNLLWFFCILSMHFVAVSVYSCICSFFPFVLLFHFVCVYCICYYFFEWVGWLFAIILSVCVLFSLFFVVTSQFLRNRLILYIFCCFCCSWFTSVGSYALSRAYYLQSIKMHIERHSLTAHRWNNTQWQQMAIKRVNQQIEQFVLVQNYI